MLLKPKHLKAFLPVLVRIAMVVIVKLDNLKATAIDIKMNVAFLKVGRTGLPNLHLRMKPLDGTPGRITNPWL